MVTTGKVFVVRERNSLDEIATKLKDLTQEETFEVEGQQLKLITEIRDLALAPNELRGIIAQDTPVSIYHRQKSSTVVKTIEAYFSFHQLEEQTLLIILEKKNRANNFANLLSKILFITVGNIVESRIEPEVLQRFHEDNFDDTKIIFFDGVDIPNVDKLSLYGSALGNTSLYGEYLRHGKIWYTVIKSRKFGYIVGVTRDGVVTMFSKVERSDYINYVVKEIFPLISKS